MAAKKKPVKKAPKKRMGRPPKKPSERKSAPIVVWATEVQKARLKAAADAAGVNLSAFVLAAALSQI